MDIKKFAQMGPREKRYWISYNFCFLFGFLATISPTVGVPTPVGFSGAGVVVIGLGLFLLFADEENKRLTIPQIPNQK